MTLVDSYGRTIDYLRISITDFCNLGCTYCSPPFSVDPDCPIRKYCPMKNW